MDAVSFPASALPAPDNNNAHEITTQAGMAVNRFMVDGTGIPRMALFYRKRTAGALLFCRYIPAARPRRAASARTLRPRGSHNSGTRSFSIL